MNEPFDPLQQILTQLQEKCQVKQQAYRVLKEVFNLLRYQASAVVNELNAKAKTDKDVSISFVEESEQEFHIRIAGDLLVFVMHTNIVTLADEHAVNKTNYVQEYGYRKYLGQINVYNFMSDSFKYNRLNDPGYLLSRLFVNNEGRFVIEGERQLSFMFEDISSKPITDTDLDIFIKIVLSQAIETDLTAPNFPEIRKITLNQKIQKTEAMGGGKKIGFTMSYQNEIKQEH